MKTAILHHTKTSIGKHHGILFFTGSIVMTLIFILLTYSSKASSTLHLTLWNQGSFMVELDHIVHPATSIFTSKHLKTGKHRIIVTQVTRGQRGNSAKRVLYNGFIEIPPNTLVKATVHKDKHLEIDNVRNKIKIRPVVWANKKPRRKSEELIRCGTGTKPIQGNLLLSAFEYRALMHKIRHTPRRQRKAQIAIDFIGQKYMTPQQAGEIVQALPSKKEQKRFHHWAKDHVKLRKPSSATDSPRRKMLKAS